MKRNVAGFTLVELLAAMVILGILMGVAIPNIVGVVNRQKANTYIEDAKRLVVRARTTFASNTNLTKDKTCFSMKYLDNGDFDEPPGGGVYLKNLSYVKYEQDGMGKDHYTITIIECLNCTKDDAEITNVTGKTLKGIYGKTYNELKNTGNPTREISGGSGYKAINSDCSGYTILKNPDS